MSSDTPMTNVDKRGCTCPAGEIPEPCEQKYALTECRIATAERDLAAANERADTAEKELAWRRLQDKARQEEFFAVQAERDALKVDAYLLDWAEKNPEAAYSAILRQWADCGRGGREKFFAFRVAIRNAKAAIDEERKP